MTTPDGVDRRVYVRRSRRLPSDPRILESRTAIGGHPTRMLEVTGDGPPILLLHGFSDSADTWRPVLAELASRSRRAIAVDLPGFGAASRLSRGPVLRRLDMFTAALVRRFAVDGPVVLAGNSMGGLLTLRAAQRSDLPMLAVAGVGSAGLSYTERLEGVVRWAARLDPWLQVASLVPVPSRVLQSHLEWAYQSRLAPRADPVMAQYYASHYRSGRDIRRLVTFMLTISEESRADPLRLDEIDVPVSLILGALDPLVPVGASTILLHALPDAELTVFDDCGHCPQVERPADVAGLLADLPS